MRTILRHLFLWISIYVVYTYMMAYHDNYYDWLLINLMNVPLFMVAYYLLRYVQIPYLYNRGKMGLFISSLILSSLTIAAACRLIGILWLNEAVGQTINAPFLTLGAYLIKTVRFYTPAMAILAWESHQERRKELDRMQELEKEKIATELKFLKAQINPHFLFNTLNNLYSFVVNQSPKAPDMIMRLSGILDYVLYRSQHKSVLLSEEIETIEHFLELEKIRYGDRLEVSFKTSGNLNLPVSPLILLSLVENAFKHGASGDIEFPRIKIKVTEKDGQINCAVWNTKSKHPGELNDAYKEGIGLSNIKRQLNLIYPEKYELEIEDRNLDFNVFVKIKPAA